MTENGWWSANLLNAPASASSLSRMYWRSARDLVLKKLLPVLATSDRISTAVNEVGGEPSMAMMDPMDQSPSQDVLLGVYFCNLSKSGAAGVDEAGDDSSMPRGTGELDVRERFASGEAGELGAGRFVGSLIVQVRIGTAPVRWYF